MKIRIKDASIRLRLTRPEVERLANAETISSDTPLAPMPLRYGLRAADQYGAHFSDGELWVEVPRDALKAWAESDEVGFKQPLENGITILVERDFQCLKPRADESAEEYYPHPAQADAAARC